jgi:hypothetical protein
MPHLGASLGSPLYFFGCSQTLLRHEAMFELPRLVHTTTPHPCLTATATFRNFKHNLVLLLQRDLEFDMSAVVLTRARILDT